MKKLPQDITECFWETNRRVSPHLEASPDPTPRSQALILADAILNRLNGYARKGSRARTNFYRRDLNWIADVLLRVAAGERYLLRPTGQ